MDPSTDVPAGFTAAQRGQPNGFVGDPDIMDTWATSSLTPQIVSGWGVDPALFDKVFPMSLRPQAHDIIRTWLFTTVLRAELEHDSLPWAHTAISGWVLDPDRKKMSKSKGNVVTPARPARRARLGRGALLGRERRPGRRHRLRSGADEGRAPARDQAAQRLEVHPRRRPAARRRSGPAGDVARSIAACSPTSPRSSPRSTGALDDYDYAKALQRTEAFFWDFCDNYVELVKARRYGDAKVGGATVAEGQASAQAALRTALEMLLRLFAPYLPFATEEVWSWWREGSVHRAAWPTPAEVLAGLGGAPDSEAQRAYERAQTLSAEVRRQKAAQKVSQKTRVTTLRWAVPAEWIGEVRAIEADAKGALHIDALELAEGGTGEVTLTLEPRRDGARAGGRRREVAAVRPARSGELPRDRCGARWPRTSAGATSRPTPPCRPTRAAAAPSWRRRRASSPGSTSRPRSSASSIRRSSFTVHHGDGSFCQPGDGRSPSSTGWRGRCSPPSAPR